MLTSTIGAIIGVVGLVSAILALLSEELKKNLKLKYSIVAVLFSMALYAMMGSIIDISKTESSKSNDSSFAPVPIAVDSKQDWQNSGIYVHKGDTVLVRVAGGLWTPGRRTMTEDEKSQLPETIRNNEIWIDNFLENWGAGTPSFRCVDIGIYDCPLPTESLGALIGKIGVSDPFLIGTEKRITASGYGSIFFRINDSIMRLNDNNGVLAVEIIK